MSNKLNFNPEERFADPVAAKAGWGAIQERESAKGMPFNFVTESPQYGAFKATLLPRIAANVLLGLGALCFVLGFVESGVFIFAAVLLLMGWLIRHSLVSGVAEFDRSEGVFRRKTMAADPPRDKKSEDAHKPVALKRIHAIQVLSKWVTDHDHDETNCFELNLILDDASRVYVVTHGRAKQVKKDAQALADFLGVPVWDASDD